MALVYSQKLPIGWQALDFSLKDVANEKYSLKKWQYKPGLLIVFTCNHCPYARASWPILVHLYEKYKQNIGFVAINPNDDSVYEQDSVDGMKATIEEYQILFPYLRDDTQAVARKYQAECTPDPYLFKNEGDGDFSLQYHGRINDNWQYPEQVTDHSLDLALARLNSDKEPIATQHPSMGCSIKWIKE